MKRRTLLGGAIAAALLGQTSGVVAQQPPIKIGMTMAQTGGLAGGGKASLLGIEIWRDDVNARGGLLGRKVELVVYDDKSSAAETPAIYSKLLDVDKVDLLFAPYATVPTAPIMPLVKQRGLLLMGNFSFQVNSKVGHDMWFNNAPWGPADSWAKSFLDLGQKAGGKTVALLTADQEFAQNLALTARDVAKQRNMPIVFDQAYPPNTVEFSSIIRALKAAKPDIVYVASYPPDSAGILRAVNEIGIGDNVKIFGGGMVGLQFGAVMENLGSLLNGVVNFNTWLPEPSMYYDGTKAFFETYTKRAVEAKVDPLGYYLAPFGYRLRSTHRSRPSRRRGHSTRRPSQSICARTRSRPSSARSRFRRTASARKPQRCRRSSAVWWTRTSSSSAAGQAGDPVPGQVQVRRSHQSF